MQVKATRLVAAGFAVIALLALFVAACSSDVEKSDLDDANVRIDELQSQTTNAQLLAFTNAVRTEDLHGLDESIADADTIDTSWLGSATRIRTAILSVEWPDDMKEHSDGLLASVTDMQEALEAEDLDAASTAATAAHDHYHELDHLVAPHLAGETPAPEEDHHESNDAASPSASAR